MEHRFESQSKASYFESIFLLIAVIDSHYSFPVFLGEPRIIVHTQRWRL